MDFIPILMYLSFILGAILSGCFVYYFQRQRTKIFKQHTAKNFIQPRVIWFTGLSGAGKTTISDILTKKVKSRCDKVEHLDGDVIRNFFPHTGFTRQERDGHIRRVAYLAACLERHGIVVIASLISPYEDSRAFARKICKNFTEVYISTSLSICEQRDVKGLYAKARSGQIDHFTGIDEPYEAPESPDIVIDTAMTSAEDAAESILQHIIKKQEHLHV